MCICTDYVVMYAGDEAARGEVVVKDMRRSSQTVIPESQLEAFLTEAKASSSSLAMDPVSTK